MSEINIPITPIIQNGFDEWFGKQNVKIKNWLKTNNFTANSADFCFLSNKDGKLKQVFLGVSGKDDFWAFGALPNKLPEGNYYIKARWSAKQLQRAVLAWELGKYKFGKYKKISISKVKLISPKDCNYKYVKNLVDSVCFVRDLINYPAEDMGPAELAKAAVNLGKEFNANVKQIVGDDLLKANCFAIYAVGKASSKAPQLIDLIWGRKDHPKVVLVGKGVCFDSGGLTLKTSAAMIQMKKDMGGAAHALGLARMIMAEKLPVNLRVIIPAVENMVSGNSFKPGDVLKTYKGLTVEITNTDAEGRLVLADALAMACENNPDLIIDFATLTGAARIALGTEIAAMFTADDNSARQILAFAEQENDPIWRMPIYAPYRKALDSDIADILNSDLESNVRRVGGAIIGALFLQEFIGKNIPWIHFDIMGANVNNLPGRPKGGEAQGLRAVFNYLVKKYGR